MAISILSDIERWITEHGSAVILKEHRSFLQAQLGAAKDDVTKLEKENADLKSKVAELEKKLASALVSEQFVEERGALFKRRAGGGYHSAVYCPSCRQSASPFPPGEEFNCKCGWFSSFTERELPSVLHALTAA
jgi:hypothetical protein